MNCLFELNVRQFSEKDKKTPLEISQAKSRLGSFYLRVGAVAFGIGSMVYSGLEIGQYFELKGIKLHGRTISYLLLTLFDDIFSLVQVKKAVGTC